MIIYTNDLPFEYELEKLTRLFFPFEKIEFSNSAPNLNEKLFAFVQIIEENNCTFLVALASLNGNVASRKTPFNFNDSKDPEKEKNLERAAVMSKEDRQFPIKVTIAENVMVIACVVQSGDVREELLVESVGKNLEIGFNPKYLIEAVRAVAEDKINLDFGSSISPCVIRPIEGNEFTYMVLPVRI